MNRSYYEAKTYRPRKKRRKRRSRFFNSKSLLIIFVLLIVVTGAIFITTSDLFNIESIEVENNQIATKEEIIARSGILEGENIYSFSASKAEEAIEQITVVKKANIHRKYPNTIVIDIEERSPFFILQQSKTYYDVDEDGKVISSSNTLVRYDVPIVTGIEVKDIEEGTNLFDMDDVKIQTLKQVFEFLKENDLLKNVSQFYVNKDGEYNLYFTNGSVLQFANYTAFSYHEDFVKYFIQNMDMKQKVELIEGVNPIYSKI
ncbi:cell division protein FtsQ/DivIB [Anaerofustis sp. NSJ-163]|uniref:cell division protein FtsQ/DivIB n=1 Tax=Anaerofustis sp. NSJ-163 TaxID=2944391 RepID=UPI00209BC079|nr:FtsQ-type POTRA domain-containing protein [Anaerofustis sp. NSJ-163]MCO8193160.1 FtsQ-type POTRA domain-containing protein [Anaerofustis sp. NSJ-163]